MSLGTGTLVAARGRHGLVVTNWHVVRDARGPINVIFPDGFRSGASVLGTDADWDLAALAIWRPNVEPVQVSRRPPQLDDVLSIAGYGSGKYRSSSGRCVQYISPGSNHPFEMLELSASARDGDSGGPIFNDRGELAGVLFGAARGRTAGSYCGRVAGFLNSVAPRFDALSTPSTETMIAENLPTPAVMPDPAGPPVSEVAMGRPRPSVDSPWGPSANETFERTGKPPQRRSMPLASIPAPAAEPGTNESSGPAGPAVESSRDDGTVSDLATAPFASTPAAGPTAPAVQPLPGEVPIRWLDLLGATRPEQARNFLAILGVVAVIFHTVKVFSAIQLQPVKRRRRRPVRRRVRVWW
jgi:hypothetical protein